MEKTLILYGAGRRCRDLCGILNDLAVRNIVIVDSNPELAGRELEGHRIERSERINDYGDSRLCVTIADETVNNLVCEKLVHEYEYQKNRIISYNKVIIDAYADNKEISQRIGGRKGHEVGSGRKTRIFDCYNGLVLGGVEVWTMDLCCALIKQGDTDTYIISDQGDYDVPELLKGHILNAHIDHKAHFTKETVSDLAEIISDKMPCEVITSEVNEMLMAAWLVKRDYPDMVRVISVIHNSNENIYKQYTEFRECTDIYIAVSQDIKRDMIARGIQSAKIYAMTCPFECDEYLYREYTENQFQPIRIGYAGRIEYVQKRMDLILKLIERLIEKQVCFVMELAGDGTARNQMEEWVFRNRMAESVKIVGSLKRSELKDFWRQQDICVNMADFEGRCISKMEGMANGAIPVITATAGSKEDVEDGVNGYIVPVGDYGTAADRIEYLSNHRGELKKMGRLAHDAVYPKSSMEAHLKFWEKISLVP